MPRTTTRPGIEGDGLFVLDDVCAGQRIIEYTSNQISRCDRERMQCSMDYHGISSNLQATVPSDNAVIDPRGVENDSTKVNRRCDLKAQLD